MNFTTDIFEQFDKKWALLTAGTMEKFNTMTISWGGLGTLWGKPVATAGCDRLCPAVPAYV